jgi:hypothetical protein
MRRRLVHARANGAWWTVSALLLLPLAVVPAQQVPTGWRAQLTPSAELRVRAAPDTGTVLRGSFGGFSPDGRLILTQGSTHVSLATADIRQLEQSVRSGRKHGFLYGILGGALAGGVIGYVDGKTSCPERGQPEYEPGCLTRGENLVEGAGMLAVLVGIPLGIYLSRSGSHWVRLLPERSASLRIAPARDGVALRASVQF